MGDLTWLLNVDIQNVHKISCLLLTEIEVKHWKAPVKTSNDAIDLKFGEKLTAGCIPDAAIWWSWIVSGMQPRSTWSSV